MTTAVVGDVCVSLGDGWMMRVRWVCSGCVSMWWDVSVMSDERCIVWWVSGECVVLEWLRWRKKSWWSRRQFAHWVVGVYGDTGLATLSSTLYWLTIYTRYELTLWPHTQTLTTRSTYALTLITHYPYTHVLHCNHHKIIIQWYTHTLTHTHYSTCSVYSSIQYNTCIHCRSTTLCSTLISTAWPHPMSSPQHTTCTSSLFPISKSKKYIPGDHDPGLKHHVREWFIIESVHIIFSIISHHSAKCTRLL